MEPGENAIVIRKHPHVWMVSLVVICLGIIAYGYFYSKNTSSDLAYVSGYNLPIGLLIWTIHYFAIGRTHGVKNGAIAFIAIYCALIASSLVGYSQQKAQMLQAIAEIRKGYSTITDSDTDTRESSQHLDRQLDTTPKSKGEAGELERYLKSLMNNIKTQQNNYKLELSAIGWEKILDPQRIRQDNNLIESNMMVKQAKSIVEKYRTRTYTILKNARNDIGTLNLTDESKRSMLSGFDESLKNDSAQIDSLWELEAKAISEVGKIITLLSARQDSWTFEDGKIVFANETDLNAFNSYVAAIENIAKQENAIRKQNINTVKRKLDKLAN